MSAPTAATVGAPKSASTRLRSIVGGSVGNLVEWYDWYVYSAFSLYFAKSFFPPANQTVQLLNAAAVFAVGFLMRPAGGWLMGRYADKHGRRAALTLSVLLMCAGSLLIAITPSYAKIGVIAPAMLVLARLLQGLSVGGEYGASATYLSEMAGKTHRGFWSSFQYVTLIMGQLLALAMLLLLQRTMAPAELESWGWRIPFIVGAALAVVAVAMRRGLEETSAFEKDRASRPPQSAAATMRGLMAHPRAVLTVVGLTAGGTVAFYTFTTYAQKFLVNTAGFSKSDATYVNAIPLLTALEGARTIPQALTLLILALVAVSGYTAINAVVKAELFPTSIRALGVGFPYAVAVSVFGGTAEYFALWFKNMGHERWFYWYVTGCILASLVVYATMPETRDNTHMDE